MYLQILANRLEKVLPSLIDRAQSAFVPGRSISDNILLAQELFRNYHRGSGHPRCALKIDLRKAFDTVNRSFLFDLLELFKFPPKFIGWIKACITTAMFSVKVNGALARYFNGARGLRQGDPISPYLFVLAMEALSMILHKGASQNGFKYHWRTKECKLTHLCFADDLLIFCHGSSSPMAIVHSCIHTFSMFSGLIPNAQKSRCFLSDVEESDLSYIQGLLGFTMGSFPIRFLGVPLISSKLSHNDCIPLIQKITSKVTSWTRRFLAYSGRLQLIKSVLFAIQPFWSTHFIFAKISFKVYSINPL